MINTIPPLQPMEIVVVAGMSGAGKTVAIKALEDCGYYPLDHLPADALPTVLASLADKGENKIAIGLDVWDTHFLSAGEHQLWSKHFSGFGAPKLLLLEAADDVLVRRYGETRRKHPLTHDGMSLQDAIATERKALESHGRAGHRIDTSEMSSNTLKAYIKNFLDIKTSQMDICLESFGFKHGAPATCDLIFDARCLPNPYYEKELRFLSGLDLDVQDFFAKHEKPQKMAKQIANFIAEWKPDYERDHRSYLTVGIGCTGGQHRSVYVAETAKAMLAELGIEARTRHREREASRWHSQAENPPSQIKLRS